MKALIVDDSVVIRKLLNFIMEEQGFDCVLAEDGVDAWEKFGNEGPYDILLVDWEMPRMNGIEFVEKVRAGTTNSKVKILMITTRNTMSELVAAMSMGIDDYLMKPIDEDSVLERIRMMGFID